MLVFNGCGPGFDGSRRLEQSLLGFWAFGFDGWPVVNLLVLRTVSLLKPSHMPQALGESELNFRMSLLEFGLDVGVQMYGAVVQNQ